MIGQTYPHPGWQMKRLGKLTSSEIHNLFTEPKLKTAKENGELSETAKTYLKEKVSELLTGTIREFSNFATDWGDQKEPECAELLKFKYPAFAYYGNDQRLFLPYDDCSGGSPDGLDDTENLVFEIKAPENPVNHIEYLMFHSPDDLKKHCKEYYCQLQMNMACAALLWEIPPPKVMGLFVSYCPLMINERLRIKELLIPYDKVFQDALPDKIQKAKEYMAEIFDHINLNQATELMERIDIPSPNEQLTIVK